MYSLLLKLAKLCFKKTMFVIISNLPGWENVVYISNPYFDKKIPKKNYKTLF